MNREQHLTLHGLAVKKYASSSSVARIIAADAARVASILEEFARRGGVVCAQGRYSLAAIARAALVSEYPRFYADIRSSEDFIRACDEFESINTSLKAVITAWQMIDRAGTSVANDHSNKDYDQRIIDRLGDVHERADDVLARMARELPRLQVYRDNLASALERAEDGAIEWISDVNIESYHTVWFELHEDLLCITGRARVE